MAKIYSFARENPANNSPLHSMSPSSYVERPMQTSSTSSVSNAGGKESLYGGTGLPADASTKTQSNSDTDIDDKTSAQWLVSNSRNKVELRQQSRFTTWR